MSTSRQFEPAQFDLGATLTRTRGEARWQIELFDPSTQIAVVDPLDRTISPRGAYQDALYDRAIILDLRAAATTGPAADPALVVRPGVDLSLLGGYRAVHLLVDEDDDFAEPAQLAQFTPGRPQIRVIRGGFAGWRAAGLPVTG